MAQSKKIVRKFKVVVWEKAEHWTFTSTVEAVDEVDAYRVAAKEFSKRYYSIRSVHPAWSSPPLNGSF